MTFLKYLFLNGGVIVDTEIDKTQNEIAKQSGLGFGLGIGLKLNYQRLNIIVNPFYEQHAFIAIGLEQGTVRESIKNTGGRIGLGYSF